MSVKYVLFYETAADGMSMVPLHFPAHTARGQEFHKRGELLLYGPFNNPRGEGSMAVFSSREGAEEFASGDPSSLMGSSANWRIQEWNEALAP